MHSFKHIRTRFSISTMKCG